MARMLAQASLRAITGLSPRSSLQLAVRLGQNGVCSRVMEELKRIERNDIAWIRETAELRYLFVSSIAHDPVYFLTEIFSEDESGWKPLICAPIADPRLQRFESQFLADATDAMEVPLPATLPAPLGRVEGETCVQYSSQRTASWGPGSSWWQRLQYRVTGRSRYLEEARTAAKPKPFV